MSSATKPSLMRTLLVLGRVSNLPTVWSNCLAGWWLGGGGEEWQRPLLALAGVTLLYVGGMFLNDAMDVAFDSVHRAERPIPSGAIEAASVWRWSMGLLAAGAVLLILAGNVTGTLGVMLLAFIIAYNGFHKVTMGSPLLMGACRWLVYLIAASTATAGVTGWAMWGGFALAAYVAGLSFIARMESRGGRLPSWPFALLIVPILVAVLLNAARFQETAWIVSALLLVWIIRCLRFSVMSEEGNVGATVGGLLAGMPLVDLLAALDFPSERVWLFPGLFLLAVVWQRRVAAT